MRASPRDCLRLAQALGGGGLARTAMRRAARARSSASWRRESSPMPALAAQIDATLSDEPPVNPRDGNVIRARPQRRGRRAARARVGRARRDRAAGSDRARAHRKSRRSRSATTRSSATTSRSPRPNLERVPADYERKQTLVGAERFTTPALKELERKILGGRIGAQGTRAADFHQAAARLAGACRGDPRNRCARSANSTR